MKQSYQPPNSRRFLPPENRFHPHQKTLNLNLNQNHNQNRYSGVLPPNFVIHLRPDQAQPLPAPELASFVSSVVPQHDRLVFPGGGSRAAIHFSQWAHALAAMTALWGHRLRGGPHSSYSLALQSNVIVRSDSEELERGLCSVFAAHVKGLLDGDLAGRWQSRLCGKSDEIADVSASLKQNNRLRACGELVDKMKGLVAERDVIARRLREFRASMWCILRYLEGGHKEGDVGEEGEKEGALRVFTLEGQFDWERIRCLIEREIRRLEDGLPIYAHRQDILKRIQSEQILVLIGETGSGKSTQLAQYLADSGVASSGAIVCTQPRKIAALTLADRVREESIGCYEDKAVVSYPTFSSLQLFDSKIVYMTDHCLLQHYMNDRNLSTISCIIVDEAHERSLNTDLLLALIKGLLYQRFDLRLIIMSATADAVQLSDYFYGCDIFHLLGRNFPVDIRYIPSDIERPDSDVVASYVLEVVRVATEIHKSEEDGTILAFLTAQSEVEWACEKFKAPSAVALPLHGKLSFEEQGLVFKNFPGKRKVIFSTNVAETSLTIPGVKYVVDSGMAKQSKFEPATGMNVLRVCMISQSSANQRAGRAGRTGPGRCYRLYSNSHFESMPPNDEPEIRRVHLGVAVLRILALTGKNLQEFDFVDAPSAKAIEMATRNLLQLGAISLRDAAYELTNEGRYLVKLGIEPRLGKLILGCFHYHLGREGLVLAAVMTNASSIFCRVGSEDEKRKADRLKVQYCHPCGDLFTLLSVFKEWESLPWDMRNKWCWENSINAKSMRRCQDTIKELEFCLEKELHVVVPSYWRWSPQKLNGHDKNLKKAILSSLAENVAMYSGYDRLGYEVALTGQYVQLHPSCSLLTFGERPNWVVFGELLSVSSQYLVCVTAVDFESLSTLFPPPLFDVAEMEARKLQVKEMTGFGSTLLKRLCGKSNCSLQSLVLRIQSACTDERIGVEANVEQNEILLFAASVNMEKVFGFVTEAVEREHRWMQDECIEKYLHQGAGVSSPMALFGAGAEIKHLELEKRSLTVDVFCSRTATIDDKELLMFIEERSSGVICSVHRSSTAGHDGGEMEKWGSITFQSPDAARRASQLCSVDFSGSELKLNLSTSTFSSDHKLSSFAAVRAKVSWPRRRSRGFAIVKCYIGDVNYVVYDLAILVREGRVLRCERSEKSADSIIIGGIDKELSDIEVLAMVRSATWRRILDCFLVRGDAVGNPPMDVCQEALLREISPFMPKRSPHGNCCRVQIFPPDGKDAFMKAMIIFDGRLHLEAAKALEHIEGKVLPGFLSWQKINCQRLFHSSISCSGSIYMAIENHLLRIVKNFNSRRGVDCSLDRNDNGSYRVRISANATKTVADLRRPLEDLMKGQIIKHASLTPNVLQLLFTRSGINLMRAIQRETKTYILFDRHAYAVKVFGPADVIADAQQKLIHSLMTYHEIHLRGGGLPPDAMKKVVKNFGPDLRGLEEEVPGVELALNTRNHVISVHGNKDLKQRVEEIVIQTAQTSENSEERSDVEATCPICLCAVEDGYRLEGCGHIFCQLCLVEQFESAIRNTDSFPLCCAWEGCRCPITVTDLRSLLSSDKLEELFRASLGAFVATSGATFRFCPSPDCPSIYRVATHGTEGEPFVCGACYSEICTSCHLEYHPYVSCARYRDFKEDPDLSLKEWCKGKEHVKVCPVCGYTIEKVEGCNHVECKCGRHICWVCLDHFNSSDDCYAHLRLVHQAIS